MNSNNTNKFKCTGTLGCTNKKKNNTGSFGIPEEQLKTKTRSGKKIETSRIVRSKENQSYFTKRGLENSNRIKKLELTKFELSQSENPFLLYADDFESDELQCAFNEERNKSIQKVYKKCENKFGNIDYEKYRLHHHELDQYAIPLKEIEEIQPKPTSDEIIQYQYGWGFVSP